MRVIAGKYRHINLVAPSGTSVTSPTLDRIKEAMFNILNMYVIDAVVVDLFSGSGALGIEALSRGASHVYFNDQDNNAQKSIKENLSKIKVDKNDYKLTKLDYLAFLNYLKDNNIKIDILLLDPPYKNNIYEEILEYCINNNLFNEGSKVMMEALLDTPFNLDKYNYKQYKYGEKKLVLVNI